MLQRWKVECSKVFNAVNEVGLVEQAMEGERMLGFREGIRRGKELGSDKGRNLEYEGFDDKDGEEELTPPGPSPPFLPPRDPAQCVRSPRMSVTFSCSKAPIISDPIPSPMPTILLSPSPLWLAIKIPDYWVPSVVISSRFIDMPPPNKFACTVLPAADTASLCSQQ